MNALRLVCLWCIGFPLLLLFGLALLVLLPSPSVPIEDEPPYP